MLKSNDQAPSNKTPNITKPACHIHCLQVTWTCKCVAAVCACWQPVVDGVWPSSFLAGTLFKDNSATAFFTMVVTLVAAVVVFVPFQIGLVCCKVPLDIHLAVENNAHLHVIEEANNIEVPFNFLSHAMMALGGLSAMVTLIGLAVGRHLDARAQEQFLTEYAAAPADKKALHAEVIAIVRAVSKKRNRRCDAATVQALGLGTMALLLFAREQFYTASWQIMALSQIWLSIISGVGNVLLLYAVRSDVRHGFRTLAELICCCCFSDDVTKGDMNVESVAHSRLNSGIFSKKRGKRGQNNTQMTWTTGL